MDVVKEKQSSTAKLICPGEKVYCSTRAITPTGKC